MKTRDQLVEDINARAKACDEDNHNDTDCHAAIRDRAYLLQAFYEIYALVPAGSPAAIPPASGWPQGTSAVRNRGEVMKLNDQATFWLDSWVDPKTNSNLVARENAKSVALHIAALQGRIQELEGENASLRGEDTPFDLEHALTSKCATNGE